MDKDGTKPKTFVSTFMLALKSKGQKCQVGKQKENGLDASKKIPTENKPGVSSASDIKQVKIPSLEVPCFKEPLKDCSICEGGNATFQGVIAGSEPLTISWLHNGQNVPSSKASFKHGAACLTLTKCSSVNAGLYTCVAKNSAGQSSSSASLNVTAAVEESPISNHEPQKKMTENSELFSTSNRENQLREDKREAVSEISSQLTKLSISKRPPVEFLDPLVKVEVCVSESAQLQCEFRSSCVPVACCWIYNKAKVIATGPRMSVTCTKSQSVVKIFQAVSGDTGSYSVIVKNKDGSAQHTVFLTVIDRPDAPASQPVVSRLSIQSLVLSWTGPSYDGGAAVLGYIVEVEKEQSPGSWSEISRSKNTSYHIQTNLEPLGEYRFRVRAYNSAGISEASRESELVKMASRKEKKVEPESYTIVSIDTKHKVRDHYEVEQKLGFGKFGEVFRLIHKETREACAGKFYRARTSKDKSAAREEIAIMNKLHHPKIVQCRAAYETRSELVMVMEYIAGGELFERIVDDNFEHTEPTSARYMQQILQGIQYVHKQNIIHLDLKPENIVCVDKTGTLIKIIDFGLAKQLEKGKALQVLQGTPEFVAPEVINYEPVGLETDMWSIGVICYILLSGESPFQGNSDAETLALVTAASFEFDPESFEDISDEAKDFICSLLKKDRRGRLSCTEALAHCWMASYTPLTRRPTKSLRKEKMKHFLVRRKWKKTGKAVLALQRMSNLSNRPDSPGSSSEASHVEPGWSQEAEAAIQSLDMQLQTEPRFQQVLEDTTLPEGATAQLTCRVDGYPVPEVKWLHNDEIVTGSSGVIVEQQNDGFCSLVVADLKHSDCGVYVCRAKNKLGEATCSAKLKVEL